MIYEYARDTQPKSVRAELAATIPTAGPGDCLRPRICHNLFYNNPLCDKHRAEMVWHSDLDAVNRGRNRHWLGWFGFF